MKQKMSKNFVALLVVLLMANWVFSLSLPVSASSGNVNDLWGDNEQKNYIKANSGLPSEETASDPRYVAANVIRYILGFLGIIAVIIVLYAGFKWMTSGGSEEKVGEAKKMLVAGVIGLVIILSAYTLASFVISQLYGATTGTNP
jgi:type IV secretory pathway VirB2 component (pilin)